MADVLVVGGGVVGCAAAFALAREGLSVSLLERDAPAAHASGVAAGMLLPTSEARGRGPLLRFALRSLALFPELCAELRELSGIDPEYEACGALHVATSEVGEAALRRRAADLPECELEWLTQEAARRAEPGLAPALRGALWSPREGHVHGERLTRAYAGAAVQLGARLETGVAVRGLLTRGERVTGALTSAGERPAGLVVVCTGAWAGELAGWLGAACRPPVEPVRGAILSLEGPRPPLASILCGEDVYLVPRRDGSCLVGATQERAGFDARPSAGGVEALLRAGAALLPELAACAFLGARAGLRPGSPDGLPLIGAVPGARGLLLAAGHFRNGVLLSPETARLIADLATGKEPGEEARAFAPERFGAGAPSARA
jgi:glycine oxidase